MTKHCAHFRGELIFFLIWYRRTKNEKKRTFLSYYVACYISNWFQRLNSGSHSQTIMSAMIDGTYELWIDEKIVNESITDWVQSERKTRFECSAIFIRFLFIIIRYNWLLTFDVANYFAIHKLFDVIRQKKIPTK